MLALAFFASHLPMVDLLKSDGRFFSVFLSLRAPTSIDVPIYLEFLDGRHVTFLAFAIRAFSIHHVVRITLFRLGRAGQGLLQTQDSLDSRQKCIVSILI